MRCERALYRVGRKSAECNHIAKTARATWEVTSMTTLKYLASRVVARSWMIGDSRGIREEWPSFVSVTQ